MKLKKENFQKIAEGDLTTYIYECDGKNFYLLSKGGRGFREISVFKGTLDNREEELKTDDSLTAWNHLEKLLEECNPEQASSGGGFADNPQQNPQILPLLAITPNSNGGYSGVLFAEVGDGNQVKIFDFFVDSTALPEPIPQSEVFVVDWSSEEVNALLKCEMIMKKTDIKFSEDANADVFYFIPKSIVNQGGETDGGEEDGGGEDGEPTDKPSDKKGKKPSKDGKPTDEGGEPTDEDGEPTDEDGKPSDKKDKKKGEKPTDEITDDGTPSDEPSDKKGKPSDEPSDEDGEPTDERPEKTESQDIKEQEDDLETSAKSTKTYSELVNQLSESTGIQASSIVSSFRNERSGELFLLSEDFGQIKRDLNLPSTMTAKEFSKLIIDSKKS